MKTVLLWIGMLCTALCPSVIGFCVYMETDSAWLGIAALYFADLVKDLKK